MWTCGADSACCRTRQVCIPSLTARENIVYFGRLSGLSRGAARERAAALIALLELEDIADRSAKGFSQGQKIKTALARALVHAPGNLILDEPTNGLDVPAVRRLRTLLVKLRDQGHCILFSSHVMQEVALLCDDVIVIAGGRVVAQGTPEALREQAGADNFEDAFVALTGDGEPLMRSTWIVFAKEFFENLRDRRTVLTALVMGPLFGPLLFGAMLQFSIDRTRGSFNEPVELQVINEGAAPNLMQFLETGGITLKPLDGDEQAARAAIAARSARVVLEIPAEYGERLARGDPAPLRLYSDSSRSSDQRYVARVRAMLGAWSQRIATQRLQLRGVDPAAAVARGTAGHRCLDSRRPVAAAARHAELLHDPVAADRRHVSGHRYHRRANANAARSNRCSRRP